MKIAIIQIQSLLDPEHNLRTIQNFIDQALEQGVEAVFLPEVFYSMSDATKPTPYLIDNKNEHFEKIQKLASKNKIFILGGSCATLVDGVVMNRSFNFNPEGELICEYDKINLFSCDLSNHKSNQILDENDIYGKGKDLKTFPMNEFKVGMSICFDLRFPEMYREYSRNHGCNILSISSAFTKPTGKAHWHTLCRARAIENQCYVVAANQWGVHNDKISTYGHSLIIDPWGEILADAGEGEKLITAEINIDRINEVRSRLTVL